MKGSRSIDLARLKKEERKTFGPFWEFLVWYFAMFSRAAVVIKTLGDEWYIVIKA